MLYNYITAHQADLVRLQRALKDEKREPKPKGEGEADEDQQSKRRNTGVAQSVKDIAQTNTDILTLMRSPNATEAALQRYFETLVEEREDPFSFKVTRLKKAVQDGHINELEFARLREELLRSAFLN